jgi:hypothetical protein
VPEDFCPAQARIPCPRSCDHYTRGDGGCPAAAEGTHRKHEGPVRGHRPGTGSREEYFCSGEKFFKMSLPPHAIPPREILPARAIPRHLHVSGASLPPKSFYGTIAKKGAPAWQSEDPKTSVPEERIIPEHIYLNTTEYSTTHERIRVGDGSR